MSEGPVSEPVPSVAAGKSPAAMRFILLTVLIDMLAVGLIVPVLPGLVGKFTANPAEQAHWYGVVTFSFALASFIGAPVLGALSDRYGRRAVLRVSEAWSPDHPRTMHWLHEEATAWARNGPLRLSLQPGPLD